MASTSTAEFHQNFWGDHNGGFEILLQNMKAGITSSKELGEFIKERVVTEDGYIKGLSKLHKSVGHVPTSTLGSFGPLWELLKSMCEKLVSVHSQFVKVLTELGREISEYHHSQKEKLKHNMKDEIDSAQESLSQYQLTEGMVNRSKKQYEQCSEHFIKFQGKLEKAKSEAPTNPKAKIHLSGYESRAKQAYLFMEAMKDDHQNAVKKHCNQLMEFQGKMSEACMKFESLEEEHLAQMATFMIKIAKSQDTRHVGAFEVYSTLNSKLDELTVEKLLEDFVKTKGTGKDKPAPYKFKPIPIEVPTDIYLSVSNEDISSVGRINSKGEKIFRKRFKKKSKNVPSGNGNVEITPPQIPANTPEVDEEGYSVRPETAANIGKFPDDPSNKINDSDSDSDFGDDEPESKIRNIRIKDTSTQPVATVEDIKASVMSLRLGAISPMGIRKATSSQSLNMIVPTPPHARKMSSASSSHNIAEDTPPSLIDIDTSGPLPSPLLPVAPTAPPHIPAPLIANTSSDVRVNGGSQIPSPLIPSPLVPSPLVPTIVTSTTINPILPPPFDARTIDITASLPVWTVPSPSSNNPSSSPAANTSIDTSSPSVARPKPGSFKNNVSLDNSGLGSIPAPPVPIKRRSTGVSSNPGTRNENLPVPTQLLPSPLQPTEISNRQRSTLSKSLVDHSGSKSLGSSPVLGRRDDLLDPLSSLSKSSLKEEHPPVPAQRGASLFRNHSNPASPPSLAIPLSPLATSQVNAHSDSAEALDKPMPIAVAVQETCNAIFKGTNLSECVVKVTGEVVMSFPASFLSRISSYKPLAFKVSPVDNLERILHNQHLINKVEGASEYSFEKDALLDHLKNLQEKASAPFYNIQILKYEVKVSDGHKLPLQVISFMKCEVDVTNYRLDYTYQSSLFQSKPTLHNVSVMVPIDGGVNNAISKPVGKWSRENNHMTWSVGDMLPADNPVAGSLQAKFNVTDGPSKFSTAQVSFSCEGDILSGLSLDIQSSGYKVSLLKKKCVSGKYVAEVKK